MHNSYFRRFGTVIGTLVLALGCAVAHAQYSPLLAVPTTNTSTLGNQAHDTTDSGNNNYAVGSLFYTGSQAITINSCSVYLTSGTVGGLVDCGVLTAPTTTTTGGQWLCHGTITETSANPNAFMTAPISACTLAAYTPYWIVMNSNDSALVNGSWDCGSSCAGAPNSGTQIVYYAPNTYGSYGPGSVPTGWEGQEPVQESIYLTFTVPNSGVVQTGSNFF